MEDFLLRHVEQEHLAVALEEILSWLDGIAFQIGALEHLFRHERKAAALPPGNKIRARQGNRLKIDYQETNRLRLYLIRLNDHVVILLNGGEKSHNDPEKCPNVRRYFKEAQQIADAIDEALFNGDIQYTPPKTKLLFSTDFEISIS